MVRVLLVAFLRLNIRLNIQGRTQGHKKFCYCLYSNKYITFKKKLFIKKFIKKIFIYKHLKNTIFDGFKYISESELKEFELQLKFEPALNETGFWQICAAAQIHNLDSVNRIIQTSGSFVEK